MVMENMSGTGDVRPRLGCGSGLGGPVGPTGPNGPAGPCYDSGSDQDECSGITPGPSEAARQVTEDFTHIVRSLLATLPDIKPSHLLSLSGELFAVARAARVDDTAHARQMAALQRLTTVVRSAAERARDLCKVDEVSSDSDATGTPGADGPAAQAAATSGTQSSDGF
jgi:hypothetical protein